jgi:hypothetical protein
MSVKKKMYIFDYDDTLMTTYAKVIINDNGNIYGLTTFEFMKKYNELSEKKNIKYNFDEFGGNPELSLKIMNDGKIITSVNDILQQNKDSELGIITARNLDNQLFRNFMIKKFNVNIPVENIFTVNNDECYKKLINKIKVVIKNNPLINNLIKKLKINMIKISNRKQLAMLWFLSRDIEEIYYYDDDINNIKAIYQIHLELIKIKSNKNIKLFHIKDEIISEYTQ